MLFILGMQCVRIHVCMHVCMYICIQRAVHTFDPDKGKSMRFLSRVHSRRVPPTVLNLMELEYMKMRTVSQKARGDFPEFSPISPTDLKIAALILIRCRIMEKTLRTKLRILLKF